MKSRNEFKVTYLNGPTMIVEISGLKFITDPTFDPSGSKYVIGKDLTVDKLTDPQPAKLDDIDYVLLSHDQHHDNYDGKGRIFSRGVKNIFTTVEGASRLGGNAIGIATWESVTIDTPDGNKIRITSTPARHGPAGFEKMSGPVTGFILTVIGLPALEIYITGDTVYYPGIAQVAHKFKPNFVFIFAGGAQPRGPFNVTMGTNDALDTAAEFSRATIIPLHYEGWSHYTQGGDVLSRAFELLGISHRLRLLKPGQEEVLSV